MKQDGICILPYFLDNPEHWSYNFIIANHQKKYIYIFYVVCRNIIAFLTLNEFDLMAKFLCHLIRFVDRKLRSADGRDTSAQDRRSLLICLARRILRTSLSSLLYFSSIVRDSWCFINLSHTRAVICILGHRRLQADRHSAAH